MKNLLLILFLLPSVLISQSLNKYRHGKIVHYDFIQFAPSDFFKANTKDLGLNENSRMILKDRNVDKAGLEHQKYKQTYKGLDVIGGTYILHVKNNHVIKSTGTIFPDISIETNPVLSKTRAEFIATMFVAKKGATQNFDKVHSSIDDFETDNSRLCVINKSFPEYGKKYALAYSVIVTSNAKPIKKQVYIDAITGELILLFDKLCTEVAHGKGESIYYGEVDFETDSLAPNSFLLQDKSRGNGIYINDYWNGGNKFEDDDNYWIYDDEGQKSSIDALYCTQAYYDFLLDRFNRNSIDNNGFQLVANVNFKSFVNAYWDGHEATFGSGDCNDYSPLTTMAIVGHEFTHGMTDFTSDLIYFEESGALNEALSDIFGESLEYFEDSAHFEWTVGTRITRHSDAKPFRSMSSPNSLDYPQYYKGQYWETSIFDNGGVHTNSSVFNYWFYMLVEGKEGISEDKDTFDVKPIGFENALDIVYQMQVNYLTENSNYGDAYAYSLEASEDLYGSDSDILNDVKEAWKAVGIPKHLNYVVDEKEIDFSILYNGKTDFSFTYYCFDELSDIELKFINKSSEKIDSGTLISGMIRPGNILSTDGPFGKIVYYDTFSFNLLLDEELKNDSFFIFNISIDTAGYQLVQNYFYLDIDMELIKDTIVNKYSDIGNVNFVELEEDYSAHLGVDGFLHCDSESKVFNYFNLFLVNRGCRGFEIEDSIFFVISNLDEQYEFGFNITKRNLFDNFIFLRNIQDSFDFMSISNLEDFEIEALIKTDIQTTLLLTDSLRNYLHSPLKENEIIDFETDSYQRKLSINFDEFFTKTKIEINKLKIYSKSRYGNIEDCLTFEDYFKTMENGFFNYITDVDLCVDFDTIKNPYLVFDMKMKLNKPNFKPDNEEYYHILRINQNDKVIDYVSETDGFEHFEIPLDTTLSPKIKMSFITRSSSIWLDNIKLVDKKSLKTKELPNDNFTVLNPVDDLLIVKSDNQTLKWDFKLFSMNGVKLLDKKGLSGIFKQNINYSSGVYYYVIVDANKKIKRGKIAVVR